MKQFLKTGRKSFGLGVPGSLLVLTMLGAPSAVNAATPPITFNMDMFGSCVSGSAADGATVNVVWRNSDSELKLQGVADHPYSNDFWQLCATDSSTAVMPGDKIKVSDGSFTRNYVVPNLTLHIDRVNDLFTGTGPIGRTIRLCIQTGDFGRCHAVRVGQDGTWSYADSHDDLIHYRIGFSASIDWTSPNDDTLNLFDVNAPFVAVTLGKAKVSGETDPRADVKISLTTTRRRPQPATRRATSTALFATLTDMPSRSCRAITFTRRPCIGRGLDRAADRRRRDRFHGRGQR